MAKTTTKAEARETIRKAIMSAATLIQDDPEIGEDTLDFLEADIRAAANALDDLTDETAAD